MSLSAAQRSARYRAKDVDAYRAKKAEYARTPEQREARREYMKLWRDENREKHNAYSRARHDRLKDDPSFKVATRSAHLKMKYGLTHDDYEAMLVSQGGGCKICKRKPSATGRRFHVDHCHETGRVRGVLCARCNTGIGWLETYGLDGLEYLK